MYKTYHKAVCLIISNNKIEVTYELAIKKEYIFHFLSKCLSISGCEFHIWKYTEGYVITELVNLFISHKVVYWLSAITSHPRSAPVPFADASSGFVSIGDAAARALCIEDACSGPASSPVVVSFVSFSLDRRRSRCNSIRRSFSFSNLCFHDNMDTSFSREGPHFHPRPSPWQHGLPRSPNPNGPWKKGQDACPLASCFWLSFSGSLLVSPALSQTNGPKNEGGYGHSPHPIGAPGWEQSARTVDQGAQCD